MFLSCVSIWSVTKGGLFGSRSQLGMAPIKGQHLYKTAASTRWSSQLHTPPQASSCPSNDLCLLFAHYITWPPIIMGAGSNLGTFGSAEVKVTPRGPGSPSICLSWHQRANVCYFTQITNECPMGPTAGSNMLLFYLTELTTGQRCISRKYLVDAW